jgi:hypothetical protein
MSAQQKLREYIKNCDALGQVGTELRYEVMPTESGSLSKTGGMFSAPRPTSLSNVSTSMAAVFEPAGLEASKDPISALVLLDPDDYHPKKEGML